MERAERIAFVDLSDGHNELFRPVVQGLLLRIALLSLAIQQVLLPFFKLL
jgi:hypothetical protein